MSKKKPAEAGNTTSEGFGTSPMNEDISQQTSENNPGLDVPSAEPEKKPKFGFIKKGGNSRENVAPDQNEGVTNNLNVDIAQDNSVNKSGTDLGNTTGEEPPKKKAFGFIKKKANTEDLSTENPPPHQMDSESGLPLNLNNDLDTTPVGQKFLPNHSGNEDNLLDMGSENPSGILQNNSAFEPSNNLLDLVGDDL